MVKERPVKLSKEERKIFRYTSGVFMAFNVGVNFLLTFAVLPGSGILEKVNFENPKNLAIITLGTLVWTYLFGYVLVSSIIKNRLKAKLFILNKKTMTSELIKAVYIRWAWTTILAYVGTSLLIALLNSASGGGPNIAGVIMWVTEASLFEYTCIYFYRKKFFNLQSEKALKA